MKRSVESEDSVCLPTLPLEVWGEILSWLPLVRVLKCDTVCRTWHKYDLAHKSVKYTNSRECSLVGDKTLVRLVNLVFLEFSSRVNWYPNESLSWLVRLEHLSLYWMSLATDATIKGLTNLSSLCLDSNRITYEALAALPSLTSLTLGTHNKGIKDVDLSKLTNLNFLSVCPTSGLTGRGVSSLVNLRTLHLDQSRQIGATFSAVDDATLHNLTNLTTLTLDETTVGDGGIARLVKLESLSLFRHAITNAGIDKLSSLTKLELWQSSAIEISGLSLAIDVTFYPSHDNDTQTEEEEDT